MGLKVVTTPGGITLTSGEDRMGAPRETLHLRVYAGEAFIEGTLRLVTSDDMEVLLSALQEAEEQVKSLMRQRAAQWK